MDDLRASRATLAGGFVAAITASACCLGPLVLLGLGVSGAWIANLTALEPYRPLSVAVALAFTALAWRRIYRVPAGADCAPGTACARPRTRRLYRVLFWVLAALVLVALGFPYVAPLFY
ncbi:MAG: mercuric ion transporter MerT [Betaproteobacteria bacterium]|nr:mercuric ion transporter MerT [Betaproteobacteria bacterium]